MRAATVRVTLRVEPATHARTEPITWRRLTRMAAPGASVLARPLPAHPQSSSGIRLASCALSFRRTIPIQQSR